MTSESSFPVPEKKRIKLDKFYKGINLYKLFT